MKKLIALLLALTLVVAFAGCEKKDDSKADPTVDPTDAPVVDPTDAPVVDPTDAPAGEDTPVDGAADALSVIKTLATAYNTKYEGTDFAFGMVGGGYETMNWEGPDAVPTTDVAFLTQQLLVPEAEIANIKAAASAMHPMNTNMFCGATFNLVDGADYAAFAAGVKAAIQGNRWMCGFPELLVIANVGDCLVVVYGNTQIVENFKGVLTATYPAATILHSEAIAV